MPTQLSALPSGRAAAEQQGNNSRSGQPTPLTVTPATCGASWRLVLDYKRDLPEYSGMAALSTGTNVDGRGVS